MKECTLKLDIKRKFFTVGIFRHWIRLPREVLDFPSFKVFKTRLDEALSRKFPALGRGVGIKWSLRAFPVLTT